jgi:hypothetical protein
VVDKPCVGTLNCLRRVEVAAIFNSGAGSHQKRHEQNSRAEKAGGRGFFHEGTIINE